MKAFAVAVLAILLCVSFAAVSLAEETEWQLYSEEGTYLTTIGEEPEVGDIYISGDNRQYEVTGVSKGRAEATYTGMFPLPDVSWLEMDAALPSARWGNAVCWRSTVLTPMKATSLPTEHTATKSAALSMRSLTRWQMPWRRKARKRKYRTSFIIPTTRGRTAAAGRRPVQLLKSGPDAIFDIHRDGIKDRTSMP